MPAAPLPSDEAGRIAALRAYEVLDTEAELAFDRLTRLAARLLDVPIALVSLIDTERQWFKSRVGLEARETDRAHAFCAHAILSDEPFVVADTAADARFEANVLVVGEPRIRAYAGAPLQTPSGHRLGTLCAIDRRPREFSDEHLEVLRELSALAVDELELRLARRHALAAAAHAREANEEQRVLFDNAPLALWTLDAAGTVRTWNRAAEQTFGWSAEEVVGRFLPTVGTEDRPQFEQLARDLEARKAPLLVERRRRRKDGSSIDTRLAVAPLLNEAGELRGFLTIAQDMAEELRLRDELRHAAMVDNLTGLLNRRGFDDMIGREIARARRDRAPLALVLFDLDHFKHINDTYGHAIGDRVLAVVSHIVRANLRGTDFGVRWGGEEILVLLPGSDAGRALQVAERIRAALTSHHDPDLPPVTLSGGVAQWTSEEDIAVTLLRADQSLYEAKAAGRDRVSQRAHAAASGRDRT